MRKGCEQAPGWARQGKEAIHRLWLWAPHADSPASTSAQPPSPGPRPPRRAEMATPATPTAEQPTHKTPTRHSRPAYTQTDRRAPESSMSWSLTVPTAYSAASRSFHQSSRPAARAAAASARRAPTAAAKGPAASASKASNISSSSISPAALQGAQGAANAAGCTEGSTPWAARNSKAAQPAAAFAGETSCPCSHMHTGV